MQIWNASFKVTREDRQRIANEVAFALHRRARHLKSLGCVLHDGEWCSPDRNGRQRPERHNVLMQLTYEMPATGIQSWPWPASASSAPF